MTVKARLRNTQDSSLQSERQCLASNSLHSRSRTRVFCCRRSMRAAGARWITFPHPFRAQIEQCRERSRSMVDVCEVSYRPKWDVSLVHPTRLLEGADCVAALFSPRRRLMCRCISQPFSRALRKGARVIPGFDTGATRVMSEALLLDMRRDSHQGATFLCSLARAAFTVPRTAENSPCDGERGLI
jgi:hypothetical protein